MIEMKSYSIIVFLWLQYMNIYVSNIGWSNCFDKSPAMTYYDFKVFCVVVNPGTPLNWSSNKDIEGWLQCEAALNFTLLQSQQISSNLEKFWTASISKNQWIFLQTNYLLSFECSQLLQNSSNPVWGKNYGNNQAQIPLPSNKRNSSKMGC